LYKIWPEKFVTLLMRNRLVNKALPFNFELSGQDIIVQNFKISDTKKIEKFQKARKTFLSNCHGSLIE